MRPKLLSRPVLLTAAALLVLLTGGIYGYVFHDLPAVRDLDAGLALPSTRIYDRHGRLLYEITPDGTGRQTSLTLDAIPAHCVNALVATEDKTFYDHAGVSVRGIARALWLNLRGREVVAGGSTITQQVARNLLLDPRARAQRTLRRKLREVVLAVRIERIHDKDAVLALWLNQTDFGNLAYGIDAAARAYFGKSASELSLSECALLVGLPQAPSRYDPLTNPDAAKQRQQTVLRLMTENGNITEAQADAAARDPLQYAAVPYPIDAPHAVLAVWNQLEQDYPDALYTTGLDVTTTIDLDWHESAQRVVRRELDRLNQPDDRSRPPANANNAAVVAMHPYTGEVYTLLGSPNYFDESISGALNLADTPRQPGSTLKPFTYALTLDPDRAEPWTPATMILDIRTPFVTRRLESYVPANFDLREHGPVLVREALASSYNIPAVIALEETGVQPLIQLMTSLGVETLAGNTDVDLSVTLGGGEVRLLNLTAAYGALANGGTRVQPQLIRHVQTADGDTLYTLNPAAGERILDERVAFLVTDMLSDDAARAPGMGPDSVLNIGRPAAAKTGTTTDYHDNWVMGYTPELVVGVWVGNADYTPMVNVTGLSGAGPIWHHVIRAALADAPERDFQRPPGLVRAEVCALNGLLPTENCTATRYEWFIEGTVPTQLDTWHQRFTIDTLTGQLADDTTPPERRAEQVYVVLPDAARAWGLRNGYPEPPTQPETTTAAVNAPRFLSPDPYTTYELSPVLPAHTQRVKLAVSAPRDATHIDYHLNGERVATAGSAPYEAWWQLAIGQYDLTAEITHTDGSTTRVGPISFDVVPYTPRQTFDRP